MPKVLLDLDNDILIRIIEFTNEDTSMPLPSFQPHWANTLITDHEGDTMLSPPPRQINGEKQTSFFAFRSTCRRIRGLAKLKGLHMHIKYWDDVIRWSKGGASINILRGIRRLQISIIRPTPSHIVSAWNSVLVFLMNCSNLEELVITGLGLCRHKRQLGRTDTDKLAIPYFDILPQLRSLDFQHELAHLRMSTLTAMDPTLGRVRLPMPLAEIFQKYYHWNGRARGLALETLYLKRGFMTPAVSLFGLLGAMFPGIKHLRVYTFAKRLPSLHTPLSAVLTVEATPVGKQRRWELAFKERVEGMQPTGPQQRFVS
ncbi:hypothetical protein IAT38_002981 [Cryptococcus sp. DSM 104549]